MTRDGLTVVGVNRATIGTLGYLGWDGLAALLIGTLGTNLLDFATVPPAGGKHGALFAVAVLIRIGVVFWVSYSVQRRLVGGEHAFRPTLALLRFIGLQIVLLVGFGVVTRIAIAAEGPSPVPLAKQWLYALGAMAFFSLTTIRLLAWNAALAAGQPFRALGSVWRGQTGRVGLVAMAFVGLILPIAALHVAMTLVAIKTTVLPQTKLILGIVDGLVQAAQLGLSCALGAVALRLAGPIEAIADPR